MERKIVSKLSVIVPIFNAENTLKKCIESIINQDYSNLEIILIDDGSNDSSLSICEYYASRDERIIVYHKDNEGLVSTRKKGLELATGEYIGFVDSDDYIDPDMYSVYMESACKNQSDVVVGGIVTEYPEYSHKILNTLEVGFYDAESLENNVIPSMLMKKGFYKYGIIPVVGDNNRSLS